LHLNQQQAERRFLDAEKKKCHTMIDGIKPMQGLIYSGIIDNMIVFLHYYIDIFLLCVVYHRWNDNHDML
jgi:hypothetical protein